MAVPGGLYGSFAGKTIVTVGTVRRPGELVEASFREHRVPVVFREHRAPVEFRDSRISSKPKE